MGSYFTKARNQKQKQNETAMSQKNNGFWLAGVQLILQSAYKKN